MKYRKRPVVIEAVQWTGKNREEIKEFAGDAVTVDHDWLIVSTLEGVLNAESGSWIIRGIQGEYYPCDPDIFAATYEPVTRE